MTVKIEQAATLDQAWRILADDPAVVPVAGATAAQLDWRKTGWPARVLDLSALGGSMRGISSSPGGNLRIGALTTLSALGRDAAISARFPILAATVACIGAPGVRTLGTIGGNLCRIAGCAVPPLLALDAAVTLWGEAGYTERPLLAWLADRAAGRDRAILVGISLPPPPAYAAVEKIGLRHGFTPSVVGIAAALRFDAAQRIVSARLCIGAGVFPARLTRAEHWLIGHAIADLDRRELRDRLAGEIVAEDDDLRGGRYKRVAAANALIHALGVKFADPVRRVYPIPADRAAAFPQRLLSRCESPIWPVRPDMRGKVTGKLKFLTDYREDGMLVGRLLRAGVPHAKIVRLDVSKAEQLPGVRAVVTARDVPGLNAYGIIIQDQPALCFDRVRYVGDPVAAGGARAGPPPPRGRWT